ncbi:MAG: enoyl-CoA hydratase/isomerase family protein, partial [Deltaproteobacteria bacterium]|nr:enoyl-CoA hydratase/isomerase family protein [Deltaproteobacteria bacterium]
MDKDMLLKDVADGVMTLTLNRPKIMNSLNFDMLRALKGHIETVRFNADIRVVIITGAGEKAFCAGADLKERAT